MKDQFTKIWFIYSVPIFVLLIVSFSHLLPKWSIVAFLLGCLTTIISSLIGIIYIISVYESKTLQSIEEMIKQKKTIIESNNENKEFIESTIEISPPGSFTSSGNWLSGTLKENVLHCKDLNSSSEVHIIVLDECQIIPVKVRERTTLWSRKNYILVAHSERNLIKNYKEFCIFFKNGKEMEEWYIYLRRASNINSPDFQQKEFAMKSYFNDLKICLSQEITDNANWFNLLTHRIFYNIHNDHYFLKLIKEKIRKKLQKIKKPSVLKTVDVEEVNFGTNMPIFKNLKLDDSTKDGFLVIDSDVDYRGGFTLKVKIVAIFEILGRKLEIPASLGVTINNLSGKLKICCSPPPADRLWLGFYEAPKIDFKIDSFIHKHKIEKLSRLIVYKLQKEIVEIMVLPDMTDFPFPKFSTKEGKLRQIQFMKHEDVIKNFISGDVKAFTFQQEISPPVPVKVINEIDDLKLLVHEPEKPESDSDNDSQAPPLPHRNHLIIPFDSDPPTPGGAFEKLKYRSNKNDTNNNGNKSLPPTLPTRTYREKRDMGSFNFLKEKISHILK